MNARWPCFGQIEINGKRFQHEVVIDKGAVRERKKGPSMIWRANFGPTPLSAGEDILWQGPVLPEVFALARRLGVRIVLDKTPAICRQLKNTQDKHINAVLHVTC